MDKYLAPAFATVALPNISPHHVEQLVGRLVEQGLAPATIRRIVATLQSSLGAAVRRGLLNRNPVQGVRLPTVPNRQPALWTREQAAMFLAACRPDSTGTLQRLALLTGMRRGELLGLTWSDLDLSGGELTVRTSRIAIGGDVVTSSPKSRFGSRTLFLDQRTCQMLNTWQWTQARCIGPNDGLVFTHSTGAPFQPWWVSRAFERFIGALGLPRIRFHDLRHLSATLGLDGGESLKEVSVRLGHADIGITANVYGQVPQATARASATRRAQLLDHQEAPLVQVVAS